MEYTNAMHFCISCHRMEADVCQEYTGRLHFKNVSGVRVTRAKCRQGIAHELPEDYDFDEEAG